MKRIIIMSALLLATTAHAGELEEVAIESFRTGLFAGSTCERIAAEAETDGQAQVDYEACVEAWLKAFRSWLEAELKEA